MTTDILTEVEQRFLINILQILQFKAGQSQQVKIAEEILNKLIDKQETEDD